LRESGKASIGGATDAPLEAFEPAFAELSDSMADLEANFMHRLNMNAFCVDFPEVSGKEPARISKYQLGF
jgi:DASH complex subunit DAM1